MGSLEYFALGKTDVRASGNLRPRHMAEPGDANRLYDRVTEPQIKPAQSNMKIQTSGFDKPFSPRMLSDDAQAPQLVPITNPAALRLSQIHNDRSLQRTASLCSNDFNRRKADSVRSTTDLGGTVKLKNNWLYMTHAKSDRNRKSETMRSCHESSKGLPDWCKIQERELFKNADMKKASGSDGTLQVLSRNLGWISVNAETMDRNKRLGKYGPFDQSKKRYDLRNSSDIAPHWMQCDFSAPNLASSHKIPAHFPMRGPINVTYLYDKTVEPRSVFNIGDTRHNVIHKVPIPSEPQSFKNVLEWDRNANPHRVTGKVGQSEL